MYCKKCGAEIRNNAKFCAKCGTPAPEPVKERTEKVYTDPPHTTVMPGTKIITPSTGTAPLLCGKCGAAIRSGAKFCAKCGASAPAVKVVTAPSPEGPTRPPEEPKEDPKLIITLPETKSGGSNGQFDEWFSDAGDL